MEKLLLVVDQQTDFFHSQQLWDIEKECSIYSVSDLWECPEDAIIGRALHDADDATNLIKAGLRYASEGYDDIKVIWKDCPEEDDIEEFVEEYIKKWKEVTVDIKGIIKDLKDKNIKKDSVIEEIFRHGKYYLNTYSDIESCEEVKEEDLEVLADEIIQHFNDAQS